MYISRHNIGNLYEARLIREMDERIVDYLNDHVEDLPFGNIFGDDFRIYVPIHKDPTAKEILDTLKRIKDYGGLDVEKGEIVRKIKLDPKYGGGEKEQRMNIGSAISKLKISDEDKKKYLDWLARYKDNMVESLGEQKYGIIISRAPIDVLRMSDFAGMSSCHTQPGKFGRQGQYFQCAIQEAINGGGVAFVVNNREFSDVLDQGYGLNDEEFFSDSDRDASPDFFPVSRLRLRRLTDDKGNEFAIPDKVVYGDQTIPGFGMTLRAFLKEKQPMSYDEFKTHDWESRGGTYFDDSRDMDGLVDTYFDMGDQIITKNIVHNRSDKSAESSRNQEIKQFTQNVEAECEQITQRYNGRMTYTTVGCDVNFDEDAYIMPYGEVTINTSDWGVDLSEVNFALERDRDDMRKAIQGDYDDDIIWSGLLNWIEKQSSLELDSFEFYNGTIKFTYYSEEVFFDSDQYDSFCDKVEDYDRQMYRDFQKPNDWLETFEEVGIIQPEGNENAVYKLINNSSEDLEIDNDRGERYAKWSLLVDTNKVETYTKYSDSNGGIADTEVGYIGDTFSTMLDNYVRLYYKPHTQNSHQQSFSNFVESYYQTRLQGDNHITKYDITRVLVSVEATEIQGSGGANVAVQFNIRFDVESFNDENVGLILFLDSNLDDLVNMATFAYLSQNRYIVTGSPRYKDQFNALKRVYSKLL